MVKFSIKTSLEDAKLHGAVKVEEIVDKAKIKQLVLQGHFIAGVSTFEYVQIPSDKLNRKISSPHFRKKLIYTQKD